MISRLGHILVTLCVGLALTAASPAQGADDPEIGVRTGEHKGFSRLVFDWPEATGYSVEQAPGLAVVRFERAARLDLRRYHRDPPSGLLSLTPRPARRSCEQRMITRARQPDRAFVLIAVLVIVGGALLVATSVMFIAHAELAGEAGLAEAAQSRALAWSGVQAVMNRLDDQRDLILDSEGPELEIRDLGFLPEAEILLSDLWHTVETFLYHSEKF